VFVANYAKVNGMAHPKAVYVRESAIVPKLDEWLCRLFEPENLDETCEPLSASSTSGRSPKTRVVQRVSEGGLEPPRPCGH
jgi:hypothetical protein